MGNCLVIEGSRKEIKLMSFVDGEILKAALPAPLPASSNKVVVDSSVVSSDAPPKAPHRPRQLLDPTEVDMGQLYRLFHAAAPPAKPAPAAVDPAAAGAGDVVRVKLVISKQELRKMLGKDGQQGMSVGDMVALMRREPSTASEAMSCCRSAGWRPALHSIPEGRSDFFY